MFLPHQIAFQAVQGQVATQLHEPVRKHFFRGMDFAGPVGDPGWFGPGSAVWHVHSHMEALIFGLQCAAYLERLDPSIYWMGIHHSRLIKPETKNDPMPQIDPKGAMIRLGHSVGFFIGTAYGSSPTAERLALAVRSMHHTIKGTRPDGARYDADDPEWLRWNYATVVWGIATAHELYHPNPLRGKAIDRYYGEFVRVGQALGGTDLPATKHETLECLKSYLPKLAVTYGAAMATGPNLPMAQAAFNWAVRDTMPPWAKGLIQHRDPNIIERTARRATIWSLINGIHVASGAVPEFEQAKARVAAGIDPELAPHTMPQYQPGSDPVRSRTELEDAFA